jgi:Fe-Mn family superoxide dismutase
MTLFGSGWIFLAASQDGALHIITTESNGNPHQAGMIPLLTLDLFEHAYYGDHRNDRGAYVDSFWEVVDWKLVSGQYRAAFPFKLVEERPTETGDSIWLPSDFQFPPQ